MTKYKFNPFAGLLDRIATAGDVTESGDSVLLPLYHSNTTKNLYETISNGSGVDFTAMVPVCLYKDFDVVGVGGTAICDFVPIISRKFIPTRLMYACISQSGITDHNFTVGVYHKDIATQIYYLQANTTLDTTGKYVVFDAADLYSLTDNTAIDLSRGMEIKLQNSAIGTSKVIRMFLEGYFLD